MHRGLGDAEHRAARDLPGGEQARVAEAGDHVLVEQNSRMALRISEHAHVLETGQVALAGPSAELLDDDHVRRLYLGG